MQTIITHRNTDYRMSVVYDKSSSLYALQFSALKSNAGQTVTSPQYSVIVDKFVKNCLFYGVGVPVIESEEQFLGLDKGTLYGGGAVCRA